MPKEWYILQYKSNSHQLAARHLNQQNFETFLPLQNISIRKISKFMNANRPLFPGYMFVAFDIKNNQWRKINSTYGVSRLITFNSTLRSVPKSLIDSLMSRCDISGKLLSTDYLKKGDQVKVLSGPFTNFIATVETFEADQRISILMDLLGRKTKIKAKANVLQISGK